MKNISNTVKTMAAACVVLFSGILFSTWVLPVVTDDSTEQVLTKPVTMNNPQKIIENPVIKADPTEMFPDIYGPRELLNANEMDETVNQAKNLFLKNVSEDVEILFNLKIDSIILEKYAEVWRVMPGTLTYPGEPDSVEPSDSLTDSENVPVPDDQKPADEAPLESGLREPDTIVSDAASQQEGTAQSGGESSSSGTSQGSNNPTFSRNLALKRYEAAIQEENKGNAYFLDVLFTDAKSATWRITAHGYQEEVFYLSCVKEDVESTPITVFQEPVLNNMGSSSKMDDAAALFYSRISSMDQVATWLENGKYKEIWMNISGSSSEYFWRVYGSTTEENGQLLIAGFRKDTYTPVSYAFTFSQGNFESKIKEYLEKWTTSYGLSDDPYPFY